MYETMKVIHVEIIWIKKTHKKWDSDKDNEQYWNWDKYIKIGISKWQKCISSN